jgi:hypothetical protein
MEKMVVDDLLHGNIFQSLFHLGGMQLLQKWHSLVARAQIKYTPRPN